MSQSDPAADQRAAEAVVRHHTELAATLDRHVTELRQAAEFGTLREAWQRRDELTGWLDAELLPHARAEEAALYPAAAAQPEGRLLVAGMLGEHQAITALVAELAQVASPVAAAAAARALQAVFANHLAKENDLVVPLLVAAEEVSLAGLLDGMHDLIGADAGPSTGPAAAGGGCGEGGGGCGCGGEPAGTTATTSRAAR